MKRIFYFLSIIAIIICALLIFMKTAEKTKKRQSFQALDQAIPVDIMPVATQHFQDIISAVGTLKACRENLLSPKVPGNVEAVLVDIGEEIAAGQTLLRLDKTTFRLAVKQAEAGYQAATASVAQVKSQMDQAKKEYNRAKTLLSENVIAQSRFDAVDAAYKAASEAFIAVKGKHSQAKTALETAKEHLNDTEIQSSISGVVVQRNAEIGQTVAPGVQVLRILDQARVRADIELPEKDFGRIEVGIPAVMTVDAFPDMKFDCKVVMINPMVNPHVRTFKARAEALNTTGKLVDGMFVKIKFILNQKAALAVPRDALQKLPGSGTYYVFVVKNNKALKREIKIGIKNDKFIEVLDGLTRSELVIINGTGRLRSGSTVKIFKKNMNDAIKTSKEG